MPACATTLLTDPELTRLPRNQSEGHLPRIALVTGRSSPMECVLRKIGIADTEFTNDAGSGRVHVYVGGAGDPAFAGTSQIGRLVRPSPMPTSKLFADPTRLALYDSVVLACEGSVATVAKDALSGQLRAYADHGGRLFLEHLESFWISRGLPPWPSTAVWSSSVLPNPPSTSGRRPSRHRVSQRLDARFVAGQPGCFDDSGQLSITAPEHSVDGPAAADPRSG